MHTAFRTYLFDLDETLLPYTVSPDKVYDAIGGAFAAYFAQWIHRDQFMPACMKAIQAMDENRGSSQTNLEVFTATFSTLVGFPADRCEQAFIEFYRTEFNRLSHLASPSPYARAIMDWLFQNHAQVAIATGFQAPLVAAENRLSWAGIPVTDYHYSFIATWDNMHASKPHPEYYQEVLAHLGADVAQCLFVGDDWYNEMVPATKLGMHCFWVAPAEANCPADLKLLCGHGPLAQLYDWITTTTRQ